MAEKVSRHGHLIAIDGSRGKDVSAAADALAARLRRGGVESVISRWDASGLFGELAQAGRPGGQVSPRTLSLVYAADLAFRLRWEIRTAIETGGVVIAAPYVETAAAFASACGLPDGWLRDLLRFAPAPTVRGIVRERKSDRGWKRQLDRGYCEYGAALFEEATGDFKSKQARQAVINTLAAERGRKVFQLSDNGMARAAKAVIGSRPAAAPRSASRRRNERT